MWNGLEKGQRTRDASWEVILSEMSQVQICDFNATTLNHFVILPFIQDLPFSLS